MKYAVRPPENTLHLIAIALLKKDYFHLYSETQLFDIVSQLIYITVTGSVRCFCSFVCTLCQ